MSRRYPAMARIGIAAAAVCALAACSSGTATVPSGSPSGSAAEGAAPVVNGVAQVKVTLTGDGRASSSAAASVPSWSSAERPLIPTASAHASPTTIGTSAGMVFTIVWPKARAIA